MGREKIIVSDKGRAFLEKGQLWMYRNNLQAVDKGVVDGDFVDIVSETGDYVASGFYSSQSHVVCRILTRDKMASIGEEMFKERLSFAYEFRKTTDAANLDNCRLVYGESDGLPGLIIDRYNDILSVQITCAGMEKRKDILYRCVLEVLQEDGQDVRYIYERNDLKAREKEGLALYKGFYGARTDPTTVINENGLKILVDVENGQKTGYFLDQKHNRMLVRNIAKGKKVLDCFSHTGGFALNAAKGGARAVVAVDVSRTALDLGHENACLNSLESIVSFEQADVFEYLAGLKKNDFDVIVLDPPAFTKSRRTVGNAYNGYLQINRMAMELLKGGGYLATCSCSRYMENALFEQMLKEAALSAGVMLRQVSVTQQNADHPVLWVNDETSYLKFYIFQII